MLKQVGERDNETIARRIMNRKRKRRKVSRKWWCNEL